MITEQHIEQLDRLTDAARHLIAGRTKYRHGQAKFGDTLIRWCSVKVAA